MRKDGQGLCCMGTSLYPDYLLVDPGSRSRLLTMVTSESPPEICADEPRRPSKGPQQRRPSAVSHTPASTSFN